MDRVPHYITSATGVDVALPIAGAGSRSYAFLIDWHIRIVLALAWYTIAALLLTGSLGFSAGRPARDLVAVAVLPAIGLYFLYHPVLEVLMRGRTPGKRMAHLRVVTRDGGVPSLGNLLVRNLFRLVDSLPLFYIIGLLTTILTREHVRVGDLAAGTLLVHDAAAGDTLATFDRFAQESPHDPALLDIVNDLLRRWPELQPQQRSALARALLLRLATHSEAALAALDDDALHAYLLLTSRGDAR